MAGSEQAPVTVIVLTRDEERNLAPCLASVAGWVSDVVVVDSGSGDATPAIAERFGARIVSHAFSTHAQQWQWALAEIPMRTEWILALDADQRVTPELASSIRAAVHGNGTQAGYYVCRRQIFRGRWIRHGGYYPKYLLKLFRRSAVSVDGAELVDHHFGVSGSVGRLRGDLIEDNQNEISIAAWTAKHNRYATLQAKYELTARRTPVSFRDAWGSPDTRTRLMKRLWAGLPRFVRPCAYVFYRYVIRLGFLDGKEGFIFHVLQGFWYRLLVDINLDELAAPAADAAPIAGTAPTLNDARTAWREPAGDGREQVPLQ